jgi:hypothetical protein
MRFVGTLGVVFFSRYVTTFRPYVQAHTKTCSVLAKAISPTCDTVKKGYQCSPDISHFWGQYSPYYSVPSDIPNDIPQQCTLTFAQILSRHGARDPTASKTVVYANLTAKIKSRVKVFTGQYAFIASYNYTLGADALTVFGQQELINSGIKFFHRYKQLTKHNAPFVRSSGEARVVESAQNWTQGFHKALLEAGVRDSSYPYPIIAISEADGSNNTLNHDLCTAFEDGADSKIGGDAQNKWAAVFVPPIQARLNTDLPGVNFTTTDVISFMDLCPFNTVASPNGTISPFCGLFSAAEWKSYDYYQSLGKYYGYGNGNPLGPTQGVGFINELIARLTGTPVVDSTSTNRTLDSNPATFPVGSSHVLFADFSHDNDMTAIFSALGLYNSTPPLSKTSIETTAETHGYSASWTVPFAARAYVEKFKCAGESEELVRIVVNDRVASLANCGSDKRGMCKLGDFVKSLSFARSGGLWNQCFK